VCFYAAYFLCVHLRTNIDAVIFSILEPEPSDPQYLYGIAVPVIPPTLMYKLLVYTVQYLSRKQLYLLITF
jgi:hypothetical protein